MPVVVFCLSFHSLHELFWYCTKPDIYLANTSHNLDPLCEPVLSRNILPQWFCCINLNFFSGISFGIQSYRFSFAFTFGNNQPSSYQYPVSSGTANLDITIIK